MMEQEEIVKDDRKAVVSSESTDKEKESASNNEKRRQRLYYAFVGLLFSLIFSFAPSYIQTHIAWIISTSVFLCCGCWAISFYHLHHYLDLVRHDDVGLLNVALVFGTIAAIACYLIPASGGKPFSDPEFGIEFRGMSFLGLLIVTLIVSMRLPEFFYFCKRNKETLKSLFTVKNIFAAIGVAIVFLTALFQLLQTLLQIIR